VSLAPLRRGDKAAAGTVASDKLSFRDPGLEQEALTGMKDL
jgi:hypothetical protein